MESRFAELTRLAADLGNRARDAAGRDVLITGRDLKECAGKRLLSGLTRRRLLRPVSAEGRVG